MTDIVILAAGQGTRLKPYTNDKPKSMVDIGGKPIIEWLCNSIKSLKNIDNIYIVSGYRFNILQPYVKTYIDSSIIFLRQYELTGTADAIGLVENYISNDFLVLAGDTIFLKEDLEKLLKTPNSLLYTKQKDRLYEFGTLDLDKDNNIKHIYEKDTKPVSNFVNCSAYHFDRRIFKYIRLTEVDKRFNERIITNSINLFINDGNEFKGLYIEKLLEVTYPKDIEEVEKCLKEKQL